MNLNFVQLLDKLVSNSMQEAVLLRSVFEKYKLDCVGYRTEMERFINHFVGLVIVDSDRYDTALLEIIDSFKLEDVFFDLSSIENDLGEFDWFNEESMNRLMVTIGTEVDKILRACTSDEVIRNSCSEKVGIIVGCVLGCKLRLAELKTGEEARSFLIDTVRSSLLNILDIVFLMSDVAQSSKDQLIAVVMAIGGTSEIASDLLKETQSYDVIKRLKKELPVMKREFSHFDFVKDGKEDYRIDEIINIVETFLNINETDTIQQILANVQKSVFRFLEWAISVNSNNHEVISMINTKIKPFIVSWLTVNDDFIVNNFIEVVHHLVKNLNECIAVPLEGDSVGSKIVVFTKRLEYLLYQINNDKFKLILSGKVNRQIREVKIPGSLQRSIDTDRDGAYEREQLKESFINEIIGKKSSEELTDDELVLKQNRNNYSTRNILHSLCFDKSFGVIANMEDKSQDIIFSIYNRQWTNIQIEQLIEKIQSEFKDLKFLESLKVLKIQLFKNEGILFKEVASALVQLFFDTLNNIMKGIVEICIYIIDVFFDLINALIDFVLKVDLPTEIKDVVKTLPPFKSWQNSVTFPVLLVSIPYTLWRQFAKIQLDN